MQNVADIEDVNVCKKMVYLWSHFFLGFMGTTFPSLIFWASRFLFRVSVLLMVLVRLILRVFMKKAPLRTKNEVFEPKTSVPPFQKKIAGEKGIMDFGVPVPPCWSGN